MPQTSAKCRQKTRGPYTPAPVRKRVIVRHISGESNRHIASEEKIDRGTVARLLSGSEVAELIAGYRERVLALVPKAIGVYESALSSRNERVRLAAARLILEGVQVLPRGGSGQIIELANQIALPLPQGRDGYYRVLGEICSMALEKCERYDVPLPEPIARLKPVAEAAKAKLLQA